MPDEYVWGTTIPKSFLPLFGYVSVQHSLMDQSVNATIWHLAGVNGSVGGAITSAIVNLNTRTDIMRRLVIVQIADKAEQGRLLAIGTRIGEVSGLRNRFSHDHQYYYSPSEDEIGYFRAENLTRPQIKVQPPTKITKKILQDLGDEMFKLSNWLSMYRNQHPHWSDGAQFPWPDKLPQKARSPNQSPS